MIAHLKEENILLSQYVKLVLLENGYLDGDKSWEYLNIESPFHRLYYIKKGSAQIRYQGVEHEMIEGNWYFLRRYTVMDYYASEDFEKYYVHFQMPYLGLKDVLDDCEGFVEFQRPSLDADKFIGLFDSSGFEFYIQGYAKILDIASTLYLQHEPIDILSEIQHSQYVALIDYLETQGTFKTTVEFMASYVDQSIADFYRKFKSSMGVTPKKYLHQLLMNRSRILLMTTNMTIQEVAYSLGFDDGLYFSRFFKKRMGDTPSHYRSEKRFVH